MSDIISKLRFASQAVKAGEGKSNQDFYPTSGPIHLSSSFYYGSTEDIEKVFTGERSGYIYTRYGNPTISALEEAINILEKGKGALAFASGMAAIHAAILATGITTGDTILSSQNLYGATYTLFSNIFSTLGIKLSFAEFEDLNRYESLLKQFKPKIVYLETVSNPLLKIVDLRAIIERAHRNKASVLVDSTFSTPYLLQPLTLGADIVIHSTTKYLSGHGDVTGGALIFRSEEELAAASLVRKLVGGILGPFEAWLTLRGLKTLPVRFKAQCNNALQIAQWLEKHPQIERVFYPGLKSSAQYSSAKALFQRDEFGAVISFQIAGAEKPQVFKFLNALKLCLLGPTLGDVYTQLLYPLISSHRDLSPQKRSEMGIEENLVRISVGIEDVEDIISDIDQALHSAANSA